MGRDSQRPDMVVAGLPIDWSAFPQFGRGELDSFSDDGSVPMGRFSLAQKALPGSRAPPMLDCPPWMG
jgi:hypothetical protein